ncbi:MAG: type IX secretion system PorP/SprF family membrane protein [Roseivirga sp.]|jgi:type IX secretion system PorP/SprF family membrane protein
MKYKNLTKYTVMFLFLFIAGWAQGQQLPQYSQYIFNGLHINPGYAGYKNEGYIQTTYRGQWVNFPGAPKTVSVTADFSANEGTMGFGVSFVDDRIGPTVTSGGLLTYAYRMRAGRKSFLSLGVSGGFAKYGFDPSILVPNDEDDSLIPEAKVSLSVPNFNSGLFFHSDRFYAGLSVFNMIGRKSITERQDVALSNHDLHYYFNAGTLIPLGVNVEFKPSVLIKQVKGSPTNYDLNAMFLFKERLWVGGSYRANVRVFEDFLQEDLIRKNAIAAILEIFATRDLRIGYAFDYNLNVFNAGRNNSHEISLGYYMRAKNTVMKNPRWF